MLTEVTTGPVSGHVATAREVARSLVASEEARRLRCDATAMVERMAAQARDGGAAHPVAAALASAARMSRLAGPEEFADRTGIPVARLVEAEAGSVPFGQLHAAYDPLFASLGFDLLSLADLESLWRRSSSSSQGQLF